jgi:membrane protease subunit HflK
MLDQLISFLQSFAGEFVPVARLQPWEGGVMTRFHKFQRVLGPGWHWRIPFVDQSNECITTETTNSAPPQSITTLDGKSVTVQANVRYSIADVQKFLIDVTDGHNAVLDQCTGAVAHQIMKRTWEECRDAEKLENAIAVETRRLVKRYGVEVDAVTLPTISLVRTLRIIGASPPVVP